MGVRIPHRTIPSPKPPSPPIVQLAMAYNSSLKSTLANSLKDNEELRAKLKQMQQDLKVAKEKNLKLADYKDWRRKAELGYDVGFNEGAKHVSDLITLMLIMFAMYQVIEQLQSRLSTEVGVALKCGLRLSYEQYEGIRFMLSHEIDPATNTHIRVALDNSLLFVRPSIICQTSFRIPDSNSPHRGFDTLLDVSRNGEKGTHLHNGWSQSRCWQFNQRSSCGTMRQGCGWQLPHPSVGRWGQSIQG